MCRDAALLCVRDFVHIQRDRYQSDTRLTSTHQFSLVSCLHSSVCLSLSEEALRSITQSDLQKSVMKMRKSKLLGGVGALLHAALD